MDLPPPFAYSLLLVVYMQIIVIIEELSRFSRVLAYGTILRCVRSCSRKNRISSLAGFIIWAISIALSILSSWPLFLKISALKKYRWASMYRTNFPDSEIPWMIFVGSIRQLSISYRFLSQLSLVVLAGEKNSKYGWLSVLNGPLPVNDRAACSSRISELARSYGSWMILSFTE